MAKGLLQSGRVTNRSRSLAAPCIPRNRTGPPSSGQGHPPLLPIAAAAVPASHAHGSSRLPLRLAAAERSPAGAWGLDRVHGARSTASGDAALPKPALCPVAGVCLGLGSPGPCGQVSRRVLGRAWGQLLRGACGCERGQGGLAGRWIAAPLQFCIPFLPDKPRRIFINQSATLFNKNLLTYK